MKPIKDIQDLINERAEKKLDSELEALRKYLHTGFASNLLELGETVKITVDGTVGDMRSMLWNTETPLFRKMRAMLLPKYFENEARSLVENVDRLRKEVENIVGQLPEFEEY